MCRNKNEKQTAKTVKRLNRAYNRAAKLIDREVKKKFLKKGCDDNEKKD